ncbi:MAG: 30S ribosomal protein S6, partial [Bifidobacterium sp.]|nr:30S ribosomal protein S6 [Bifidobacterium sp.]
LEVVTKEGGSVDNIDVWGRRKLAYEIDKHKEGNYVVVEYTCEPSASAELDRVLNLNESVIRTKILRKDDK